MPLKYLGGDFIQVICITGKAGSGKDTAAEIMKKTLLGYGRRVLIIHYADLLKWMCKQLFGWNGEKDEYGRWLLQHVGTDVVRAKNPDFWVDFVAQVIDMFRGSWDYVIIPDCRFPNEVEQLGEYGITPTVVRIERDNYETALTAEQQQHPSETAMDDYDVNTVIHNNGTLSDLTKLLFAYICTVFEKGRYYNDTSSDCESCKL